MYIDCWDIDGASVEECGPQLPSAPQNLNAIIIPMNESVVVLRISWRLPAKHLPYITAYKIVINNLNTNFINGVSRYEACIMDRLYLTPLTDHVSIQCHSSYCIQICY